MRTGCSIRGLRNPRYEPATFKGTEMTAHRAKTATIVPNGTAPDESDPIKKKFNPVKPPMIVLSQKKVSSMHSNLS